MGGTISKSKIFVSPKQSHSKQFSCSTTSSERTMVDPTTELKDVDGVNKKPSILPNNSFFGNFRDQKRKNKDKKVQQYHYTANISSMSRRRPKYNKKKKVVTKSIIGRPSNFKVCMHILSIKKSNLIINNSQKKTYIAFNLFFY